MRHACQLGFFINGPRFLSRLPDVPTAKVHAELRDALLNVILLWGCRLSSNPILTARQDSYLTRAVQLVSSSMFLSQASVSRYTHDILYAIQAEVLLSNYFFASRQLLEGRYHCTAAVSLAISCRLNRLNGNTPISSSGLGIDLSDPADSIEAGERIDAFWTVYVLDKSWAVALGSTPTISTEQERSRIQIFTPWPTSMNEYQQVSVQGVYDIPRGHGVYQFQGLVPRNVTHTHTMREFLFGTDIEQDDSSTSPLNMRTKAVALCERANWLSAQYRLGEFVISRIITE